MYDESPINIPSLSSLCVSVPCPMPTLGVVIFRGSSFLIGLGTSSYPEYAPSLFTINDALGSSFAAGVVLLGRPLYFNKGWGRVAPRLES
ncbi:unnamed protein product [Penicillium camemberti]|uniref:Str. FM013 n=1 Tax=Penicillium camemberti (strain FM 013) TaxID=1429867 RepID=A0A0G4P3H5_PENC3|nr:unnamed protein product [Penicillium camemberti]